MPARRFLLTVAVTANLAINAVAIPVAVAQRWAAGLGATPDPNHVADQWAGTGTAISAPLPVLVALLLLLVLALLPWRSARTIGSAGSILVGLILVIGNLGEPTMFHPASPLEEFFHVLEIVFAVLLIIAAYWNLAGNLRRASL